MRPGQEAPDEGGGEGLRLSSSGASMRPGQEAPDELPGGSPRRNQPVAHASMRPGQEAPDEGEGSGFRAHLDRFNEAGARSPG